MNLRIEIKNKSFNRLSYADKENIKLIENNNYSLTIEDMIKDPILLKIDKNIKKPYQNKTIGILVVKKNNKYVIEYTTNDDNNLPYYLIPPSNE